MGRLDGKVAVITGGANGLGEAIATRMAEEGALVAVLDIDKAGGERVAGALAGATFHACDVTSEQDVSAALTAVRAQHGRIDVLVNNAGVEGVNKPTHELPLAEWERVMGVNCTAVFLCTKHAIPYLKQAGGGSVINISSIYGILGGGDIPAYHASKGAVRTMSKNDALTYAPDNIRVNSIHPGFIFTSMVKRYVDEAGLEEADARTALDALHPLGGTGDPDDVAWGAVFLASDQARWVTGAELVIDGGYSAR
ncbi:MAG TPA: SDR family oxidoreductase [Streptosporangiaceae bacterium]|jgi:NAD(P)-dependent dehydrogenase (short-subunit alcohol dehydrogenase family)